MQQQPQEKSGGAGAAPTSNLQEQMANAMEKVNEAAHNVGQRVTDFFQGDPFSSPVGRKIELATDATKLATENWGLNMEICDFINCTNEGPRDALRAIKKRLQTQMGKNNAIVMYTLTVLETCVKNCDQRFAILVTNKEFVSDLVKLISTKHDAPQIVQERVLGIIQSWADAFRSNAALSGVVEMYDELRAKGVEFPATNFDAMAPIITPKQDVQLAHPQHFVGGGAGPVAATPEQLAKLRSELDIAQVNLTVLRELLAGMKPNNATGTAEPPEDFHFIRELYATCKEMQKRILGLIPVITNEEVTFELLSVNDELNSAFEKYDRCMANFNAQGIDVSMVPSGSGTQQKQQGHGQADLIDLGGSKSPLADQFQNIDIHNGNEAQGNGLSTKKSGLSNDAYVTDQAELPIRSVAYNKPEPDEQQQKDVMNAAPQKKPPVVDDGL